MPLSEFYRSANGKNENPQQKPTDVSYISNNEFVELVWEKGQIMMQGQSSKARKTPIASNFQFHTPKIQEKEGILDVPLVEMGLNQDDEMVPWLNYPLDDYCSDLLPEISGVTVNEPHMRNGLNVIDKSTKDSHSLTQNVSLHRDVSLDQSKVSRSSNLFSWSLDQVHISDPSVIRSGVSEIGSSNRRSKPHKVGSSGRHEKIVQRQDSLPPYSTSTLLNFSHFSRPGAMAKATLQNNEHHAAVNVMNRGPQKEIGSVGPPSLDSGKVGPSPFAGKPIKESCCVEKSCDDYREDATAGDDKSTNVVLDANAPKVGSETEKCNEPVGATSSVCSGNSVERASNDLTKYSKRTSHDTEDFECQSQDVEEESLGTKTAASSRGGTGSKRSRAAEVHNLSERRRRDRINEKMRALQELIPNCNKVDKASMLDEAIEYLKTLQLQVQIMSLGTGLCMPPMMFPTGMHPAHVPHLSPMGIGMGMSYGMGMGMGMGVTDMNGGPQGHPHMFPFPPATQASRHPVPTPPISGLDCCQGIPRSTFPGYGHPGQGMPMLYPQQPMPGFPMNPPVRQFGTQAEIPNVSQSSKDPMQHKKPNAMTQTQMPSQSTMVEQKDQTPETGCGTAGDD